MKHHNTMVKKKDSPQAVWWVEGLASFQKISAWILGPLLISILLGLYLDRRYDSKPKFLLISVFLAFLITNIGLVKEVIQYNKRIDNQSQKNNKNKNNDHTPRDSEKQHP